MRASQFLTAGVSAMVLGFLAAGPLAAQVATPPLPSWRMASARWPESDAAAHLPASVRRSHAGTGLLIGSAVGAVATTVFLIGFCGDADSECGADEFGRAVVVIAVPCAAAGALVGWLIRTDET
jgi:hypothetical protein